MTLASLLARHWPFANGSGRIIDRFARSIDLGAGPCRAWTNDGFAMTVLADDHIGRHIILSGGFDRSIVQLLLDKARPGDVLLDIGANIGYVSACFLKRVSDSTAVCVEPQPVIVDLLTENMAQFGDRAIVHQVALSDTTGELRFAVNGGNRGASRVDDNGSIFVPAVNASDFLNSFEKVDLVKIDVEGHESLVLKGMEEELCRLRPRAILFEDHTKSAAPDGEIGSILGRCGYKVYGVRKTLFTTNLDLVETFDDCDLSDYIAVLN
jgi:FkbM family methyltransferase